MSKLIIKNWMIEAVKAGDTDRLTVEQLAEVRRRLNTRNFFPKLEEAIEEYLEEEQDADE